VAGTGRPRSNPPTAQRWNVLAAEGVYWGLADVCSEEVGLDLEPRGYFRDAGPNGDLADLGPVEVLEAYLAALSSGNAVRANACELPDWRLQCFTPQYIEGSCALYSPDAPHLGQAV